MNRANAINRAAAAGLVAMLPHPTSRVYLRVRREACGCTFDRHVQGYRLENAGLRCPICGNTDPSPPVPAPILLVPPEERKYRKLAPTKADLAYEVRDLRESLDAMEIKFTALAQAMQTAVEDLYAEIDALKSINI
jgi:hypothetical protein